MTDFSNSGISNTNGKMSEGIFRYLEALQVHLVSTGSQLLGAFVCLFVCLVYSSLISLLVKTENVLQKRRC